MEKLNILWTSKDKDTFMYMVAMYASNSIKSSAWDEVNIIIWGGSTRTPKVENKLKAAIILDLYFYLFPSYSNEQIILR